ncbi:ER membrane protein complex subunit 1-like isoform X2 [Zophobas morio]|uniref:ER membrane protein complex subunit 1-like isoform X2 n=1 Tax=Zophobas morio TaxID=2755281 RepID=UPI003082715F
MKLLVQEFGVNEDSPLSKFIKRISSQALQFKDFVRNLLFGDLFSNKIIMKGDPLHNSDFFGFKKLIVCVSSTGKIYGLSSDKGSLLWSVLLHEDFVVSAGDVFAVTRFPSPLGLPPLCLLSCSDRGGQSYIYELDPLHGSVVRYEVPFTVKHALVLNEVDGGYNKPTIFLSYKEEAHVWPKTPNAISLALRAAPRLFFYSVNKSTGKLDGRRLLITNESVLKSVPAWSVTFSLLEETMLTVSSPRHYEQVKVLYKSVDSRGNLLYKYLNPNMIAVATHSPAASELVVYLIDTVTGRLLHRTFHPRFTATRPVTIVHSENSVYYHFWDSLEMKYIFVSLDLYEQKPVEKRPSWQPFSSFLANNPVVVRQSYYFFEGLSCASVTQTKQGITMKQLLLGLNNGQLYALDKRFLDTRRTTADKSSIPGVPVYSPVHTMDPLNVINYNRTVPHIKNIITSTTRLESLGLVFAYGLGLYSTRITPSGTFDTLSEGFNKPMLVMTTAGLIVACIIVRELMYKKKLASQWT